ncbi:MAG: hypothetical protein A2W91_18155 [Bacteroidetes bacterium GWF2_38_335]|nr:MAG: hypothetical protein A2W91_18155 [Bacteroidetes bacterium GWF2_38_335]OFY80110.1 MAG: hypothetical protein A2281_12485 [Bacteroidetes bacterium RIFOXYA12_FULL_38_20]HBS88563.1 hypothetical protein [Bacteroidales bacterium]
MKKTILFALMALLCPFIILSQGINWKTNGNSGINSNNFIGTINKADLIFKTHDTTRMVIGQNGTIEAFDDVRVHGTLFVGDSTIALTDNSLSQTPPLLTAEITSGNGRMALGRSSFTGLPFIASNFSLGVGGSHHQHKVHIESQSNNVAFEARIGFTNNTTGHNASTLGSTVGLINGSRNFLINQQENASIFFNTSGLPRMNIIGNGNVGIGDYSAFTPFRRLDVFDDSDVPQFRLTYNTGAAITDFYVVEEGFLLINPSKARVGINLSDVNLPTEALDINGDVRIRQMPLNNTLTEVVVIDASGKLFRNTAIGSGGGGGDADWYEPGNTAPNHIDDDIFTFNNVSIGASSSFSSRLYSYNGIDNAHHQTNMKHSIYSNTLVDPTYAGGSIYGIYSYMVNSNPLLNVKKFAVLGHTACNSNETFNVAIKGDISGG